MFSRATLPAIAALALTGTAAGLYLGKAAVAEINPIYYQAPEARFHGDLVPYRPTETAAGYQAGELSPANLEQALGRGCIGCRTYPEEVILVHRGRAEKYEGGGADLAPEPVQAAVYEPPAEFAAVERYASYPVVAVPEPQVEAPAAEVELAAAEQVSDEVGD